MPTGEIPSRNISCILITNYMVWLPIQLFKRYINLVFKPYSPGQNVGMLLKITSKYTSYN